MKPLGALHAVHSGIPEVHVHQGFWSQFRVECLFDLYMELNATYAAVLAKIEEPEQTNAARSRVFGFLDRQYEVRRSTSFFQVCHWELSAN